MIAPQAAALSRAEALGGSREVFLALWYFPYLCVLQRKSLRLTGTFHFPICLPVLVWGIQGEQVEEVAPACWDDPPACPGLITQLSAITAVMMAPWAPELLGVSQQPLSKHPLEDVATVGLAATLSSASSQIDKLGISGIKYCFSFLKHYTDQCYEVKNAFYF